MTHPRWLLLPLAVLSAQFAVVPSQARTLAQMKGERRVLVVAAPSARDARLAGQRRELARWRDGAADRDLSTIELVGGLVHGSDDDAATLRRRLALPATRFAVALVGKDGHVALRSDKVVPAHDLETTIDAMPMRRAGQR